MRLAAAGLCAVALAIGGCGADKNYDVRPLVHALDAWSDGAVGYATQMDRCIGSPNPNVDLAAWRRCTGRYPRVYAQASRSVMAVPLPPGVCELALRRLRAAMRAVSPRLALLDQAGARFFVFAGDPGHYRGPPLLNTRSL